MTRPEYLALLRAEREKREAEMRASEERCQRIWWAIDLPENRPLVEQLIRSTYRLQEARA